MPKLKVAAYLMLGVGAVFSGTALGRYLGLSQFASVGVGLVPALLLLFPVMRQLYGGRLNLTWWLLTVAGIVTTGMLIHLIVG